MHRTRSGGLDEASQARIARHAPEFLELLFAGEQHEAPFAPGSVELIRRPAGGEQRATKYVGVEDDPHRRRAKYSARTFLRASSIADSISVTDALALRALVSATVRSRTRQRTASSMNLARSPFFMPR